MSGREASVPQVHDNIILGYSVSSERRELVIHTEYQDREPTELTDIVFRGVEAYHLIGDTLRSVLFDVEESPLGQIIGEFSAVFEEGARYSWPGTWNRSPESCLLHFRKLGCRGWAVSASYGLWGFVIAREIEIRDAGGSGAVGRVESGQDVNMSEIDKEGAVPENISELRMRITQLEETLLDKVRTEEALQDSEKRYRRLFESAKDGILILDAETGRVVDVNPFLLRLLGYSFEAMHGQFIWDLGVFKDIAASKDAFRTLQDNEYIRYEDLPLETLDGRPIAVEFVSNVYLVDHSKVIQCNIRDITERRRTERALAKTDAKLRSILDNIGIGVALISPGMEILELNRRIREWFPAVDPDQHPICYRSFSDPPSEVICENCPTHDTFLDGLVHESTRQTLSGGKVRDYRLVSSPIRNESGQVTAVIEMVEDITEKLSLESQFLQAQKMEAVGLLAGGMAHDYNNMLTVIIGYADLAMSRSDPALPIHADLEEILKAANLSADITRQLLAFARKQTIAPVVLDLNRTVESMLTMLRRLIGEEIDLAWLPKTDLCPVRMDPAQVDQILANLCINARDAIIGNGRITIETGNVHIDEEYCSDHAGFEVGEYVLLAVSDDGCGMDHEMLARIFEPFFSTKSIGKGTGLGLSTVYGIVRQNNGFINVYSEPGNGTTFRIYFPRCDENPVQAVGETSPESAPSGGEMIMVVEDDPVILLLCIRMLKDLGYKVLAASTPGEAIALAEEHTAGISLLFTDVVMPDMNGRDLAARMKVLCPGIRCLFMSGYTAEVIARRAVLDTGVHFIQKPFSMKDLALKVGEALRGRTSEEVKAP